MANNKPDGQPILIQAFDELDTLVADALLIIQLEKYIVEYEWPIVSGYVTSKQIYEILKQAGTDEQFLADGYKIKTELIHLLLIHIRIEKDHPNISDLSGLQDYIQADSTLKNNFQRWSDKGEVIVYLERKGLTTWNNLALTSTGDWHSTHLLDGALTYCVVNADSLFAYLANARNANPNDMGFGFLGSNIKRKIQSDDHLKNEIKLRLAEVYGRPALREMLPTFIQGIVNQSLSTFKSLTSELVSEVSNEALADTLYALGTSCPNELDGITFFNNTVAELWMQNKLDDLGYAKVLLSRDEIDSNGRMFCISISAKSDDHITLNLLLRIVYSQTETQIKEDWYRKTSRNLIKQANPELIPALNGWLHEVVEKDHNFVYELFTCRFENLSDRSFLENSWHELVRKDNELFSVQLTEWFLNENKHVHRALLQLCMTSDIAAGDFQLSSEVLTKCTSTEKLYLAYKIAGYCYGREQMQYLLFSLMESVLPTERSLLQKLFNLFYHYVIYNYRSTLDHIKQFLKAGKLPEHLLQFYQALDDHYESYFKALNRVKPHIELRPNSELSAHIRFFMSQKFNEGLRQSQQNGLGSFFKTTAILSHRWAIRRPGERTHTPQTMGNFQTSMEFPAGEKINPVFNERTRVLYQQMKKDEVNLN